MTILDKPLRRVVRSAQGVDIVVEIMPADAGIPAHIKLRVKGRQKSYFTIYIEAPAEAVTS